MRGITLGSIPSVKKHGTAGSLMLQKQEYFMEIRSTAKGGVAGVQQAR